MIWNIRGAKQSRSLFLLQPTNAQIYITSFSLYMLFTATYFDTSVSSSGSFKNLYLATLHRFLELKLLKLQFHKTIRWKLFGCHWVMQYSLYDITVSCEVTCQTSTQSTVTRDCICSHINTLLSQDIVTLHRLYCITQWEPNNFHLIILWNCNFNSCNYNNWCTVAK